MRKPVKTPSKTRKVVTKKSVKPPKVIKSAFKGTTYINVILDSSGSMGSVKSEVISGYNSYIETLKKDNSGPCRVSLTTFNSKPTVVFTDRALDDVVPLTDATYVPAGFTALFDAIGVTTAGMKDVSKKDRVLTLIITDGQENSSKEITKAEHMRTMISDFEKMGNFTFTYLSASPTAFTDSSSIGVGAGNTMAFTASAAGVDKAIRTLSTSTNCYRSMSNKSVGSFYNGSK